MNKSESIAKLAQALSKFQSEVENPKNTAKNPFFSSSYAPLNEVLNVTRPILSKHGLSVIQSPGGDGQNISINTMIIHESGEWIEFEPLVLKAEKMTPQGAGSAVTYGRRYSLSAVLGISSEDDDDGNHASQNKKGSAANKNTSKKQSTGNKEQTVTQSTFGTLKTKWLENGTEQQLNSWIKKNFKCEPTEMTERQALSLLEKLESKGESA